VVRGISQPSAWSLLQSPKLVVHTQLPSEHAEFAPQALQLPQLARRSTSQPSVWSPLQSAKLVAHTHLPAQQAELGPQTLPHAPQLA
jgi:hypothetical protein